MNGKIFKESANLYQDEAKILFRYYRSVAEKIVLEEEEVEKKMTIINEHAVQLEKEAKKYKLYKLIGLILFFTVVGLVIGIIYLVKENKLKKEIGQLNTQASEFKKLHAEIFRNYKVRKIGVAYIPVASQIAFENQSFYIDQTDSMPDEEFKLQNVRQQDLLVSKINELDNLSTHAPFIESSDESEQVDTEQYSRSIQKVTYHDFLGKLDRNLRTSAYCLHDVAETVVKLPVIYPGTPYADFLKEHSTTDTGDSPIFDVFDSSRYDTEIEKFHNLNELRKSLSDHSEQFEDVLRNLMVRMADSVQALTSLKVLSSNKLVQDSNKLLLRILKSSYNHYSPILEADEIERIRTESFDYSESVEHYKPFQLKESSRVRYDLISDSWVSEDGSKTNYPFGISQIQEEIVAPIVQNLLEETRIERLKIYNNIKDQKINYLNQWHQDTEDFYGRNRAESADLINLMRGNLRDYIAAYNTLAALEKTNNSMKMNESLDASIVEATDNSAESLMAYDMQSREFKEIQENFDSYMMRLKDNIDEKARKFEYIEYYDASLRDSNPKKIAEAASRMHELDSRRKVLTAVNPLFAQMAELPPEPDVESIVHEHMSINLSSMAHNIMKELKKKMGEPEENEPEADGKMMNETSGSIPESEEDDRKSEENKDEFSPIES